MGELNLEIVEAISQATREARDTLKELHQTIKDARQLNKDLRSFMRELDELLVQKLEKERKEFAEQLELIHKEIIQTMVDQTVKNLNQEIEKGALGEAMNDQLKAVLAKHPLLNL